LPGYTLPVYPALAILAALALRHIDDAAWGRQLKWALLCAVIGLCASPAVALLKASNKMPAELLRGYAVWVAVAFAVMVAGICLARQLLATRGRLASVAAYACAMYVAFTVAMLGHEPMGRRTSGADLVPAMNAVLTPDMPIYSVRMLDHTLPFYLRRTTVMVEAADELGFGTEQEPEKWVPTVEDFIHRWQEPMPAMAIMSPQMAKEMRARNVPMRKIAEDAWRVVVVNPAAERQQAEQAAPLAMN
jgi:multidrug transporter EmrE-like cation transporter